MKPRQNIQKPKERRRGGSGRKPVFRETTVSIEGRCYRTLLDYYLRIYLDTREYLKRAKQRLAAMDQNTAIGDWPRSEERHYLAVHARRKSELKTCLLRECRKRPEHKWLMTFPGIGPVAEAALLAKIDIQKAQSVSSLWRFCGLGLEVDGTRQRPIKRKKRTYCAFLKAILIHDIGSRVLISTRRSPGHKQSHAVAPQYRALYFRFKAYYGKNHSTCGNATVPRAPDRSCRPAHALYCAQCPIARGFHQALRLETSGGTKEPSPNRSL